MDPNETLRTIRELIALSSGDQSDEFNELAYHVDALDVWLSRGGFLPDAWDGRRCDSAWLQMEKD